MPFSGGAVDSEEGRVEESVFREVVKLSSREGRVWMVAAAAAAAAAMREGGIDLAWCLEIFGDWIALAFFFLCWSTASARRLDDLHFWRWGHPGQLIVQLRIDGFGGSSIPILLLKG